MLKEYINGQVVKF